MDDIVLESLARKHGIRLLLQFGSTVTGREHAGSDVDLAVLVDSVPDTFAAHADLQGDLQALFPGRNVDVALINRADPLFLKQIIDSCCLLYGVQSRLDHLRICAFKRYQDHRRFLAMEREYVRRFLEASAR